MSYAERRFWMLKKEILLKHIAVKANRSISHVSLVISGKRKSAHIKNVLEGMGCPEEAMKDMP